MEPFLQIAFVTVLLTACASFATRSLVITLTVITGFLLLILPVVSDFSGTSLMVSGALLILFLSMFLLPRHRVTFRDPGSVDIKWWRIIARPFAILFIPIRIFAGQRFVIYLLGGLSLFFIATDLFRILFRCEFSAFFKKSEFLRFSSMTSFLVAIFILFLLFPPGISYLCLAFVIFGDMAAKQTGLRFGRIRILHEKSLEGSLGFLAGCLFAGTIVWSVFRLDYSWLIIGALFATLTELFSFHLDDNFTVGILTGGCLYALQYFHVI